LAIIAGAFVLGWGVLDLRRPDLVDRYAKYRAGVPATGRGRRQVGWFFVAAGAVFLCLGVVLLAFGLSGRVG
jgi:hypothetical protein